METRSSKRKRGSSPGTVASTSSSTVNLPLLPLAETELNVPHSKIPPSLTSDNDKIPPPPTLTSDNDSTLKSSCRWPPTPSQTPSDQNTLTMRDERDIFDLYATDYQPVWAAGIEFPGDIPEEISQYLYEDGEQVSLFIGPLSSLFWLEGVEELEELIHDPAYILTDEYRSIPQGSPRFWIISVLFEEGKIPATLMAKIFDEPIQRQTFTLSHTSSIPPSLTTTPTQNSIQDVFPFARLQSFPPTISCVKTKLKGKKNNRDEVHVDLLNTFINSLGGNLLYKGLSRPATASLASLFAPLVSSNTLQNEFGPGLYATPSLKYALDYAGPNGVILIFKDVDFRPLVNIDLAGEDWRNTVDYWTGATISNVSERVPALWERSDILQGQISVKDLRSKQRVPGPDSQVVGVSYTGLNAFASALHMIIWLDSSR